MIWKPHATVAAIVEQNGKFLMVEESVEGEIVYNQPAGHLDPNETLLEAVVRETREETAWLFKPEALIGIYLWEQPHTERTFYASPSADNALTIRPSNHSMKAFYAPYG